MNNFKNERKEGFWKSKYEPHLPNPVSNEVAWVGQDDFVSKLEQVEKISKCIAYRGFSICRICGKHNGHEEFSYRDWVWPQGLLHYIVEHNVEPSEEFQKFIEQI